MRAPTTDDFEETDSLESLEVGLTPRQIEWLQQKAEERGLSIDHMLRSVITAQIRAQSGPEQQASMPAASGDGQPQSSSSAATVPEEKTKQDATEDDTTEDDSPSIVDSLRSASERLQDLTEEEEGTTTEASAPHDTLERLQARLGDDSEPEDESEDASHGSVLVDDQNQSMFDMMEE